LAGASGGAGSAGAGASTGTLAGAGGGAVEFSAGAALDFSPAGDVDSVSFLGESHGFSSAAPDPSVAFGGAGVGL
jgi:hypothetical protein